MSDADKENHHVLINTEHKIPWTEMPIGIVNQYISLMDDMPDLLCTMYTQQRIHLDNYASDSTAQVMAGIGDINHPVIQAKLREFASYTVEELYEAINHLKNKPWKKTYVETDRGAFIEEIADAFHFFLEFLIFAGITPEVLFRAYFAKTLTNIERQRTGY